MAVEMTSAKLWSFGAENNIFFGMANTAENNPGSPINNLNAGAQLAAVGSTLPGFAGGWGAVAQIELGAVAAETATAQLFNDLHNDTSVSNRFEVRGGLPGPASGPVASADALAPEETRPQAGLRAGRMPGSKQRCHLPPILSARKRAFLPT
jgi:hypothetical protein